MKTPIEKLAKHTNAILVPCKDREQWLAERPNSIGGSETPDLYGVGYGSPIKVWADKVSPSTASDSTESQEIKLEIEPIVISRYLKKFGGTVDAWPQWTIARHPDHPFIHSTPDGLIDDPRIQDQHPGTLLGDGIGSFSIKSWSEFGIADWANGPPLYSVIQVQTELAVLNLKWAVIAVMFGTQRVERYFVERNDYFIEDLYKACQRFWRLVTDKIEPPIDESRATAEALYRLHPNDSGKAVYMPAEADQVILDREEAKESIKSAERIEARCENQLKAWIGDHTFGVTPEGRIISWKSTDRKGYTVAATTFRQMRSVKALPKGVSIERVEHSPSIAIPTIASTPLLESANV